MLYRNKTKQNKNASSPVYVFPLVCRSKETTLPLKTERRLGLLKSITLATQAMDNCNCPMPTLQRRQHCQTSASLKPKVSMMGSTFKEHTPLILQSNAEILTQKATFPEVSHRGQDILQDKQCPHSWAVLQDCSGIHLYKFPGPTGVFQILST